MSKHKTIFRNLLDLLPKNQFKKFVGQHDADKYYKSFSCWNQLVVLLYAQITGKDSLRDIEIGFRYQNKSWNHLGVESISKSNLSYANTKRPFHIYEKLFYEVLQQCKTLQPEYNNFELKNDLYSLDSTTISLCLSMFSWAKFRKQKGAFKLHTLFNTKSQIPELIVHSDGKRNDIAKAREMDIIDTLPKYSFLAIDRAYIDYAWLYKLHKNEIFFVSRKKKNMNYVVLGQHKGVLEEGVLKDEKIAFILDKAEEDYPDDMRKITYYDKETDKIYEFITNNFELSSKTIADIYKSRWQIELFFKWIKQHLKIKTFLGTSENAVMTQIWVAMIYYLLLSFIKFQTKFKKSLLYLARIIQETLLHNVSIIEILSLSYATTHRVKCLDPPDLTLF